MLFPTGLPERVLIRHVHLAWMYYDQLQVAVTVHDELLDRTQTGPFPSLTIRRTELNRFRMYQPTNYRVITPPGVPVCNDTIYSLGG